MNQKFRPVSLLLVFCLVASLVSCSSLPSVTTTQTQDQTATQQTVSTEEKDNYTKKPPVVPNPITWDDINALPIASSSMSQDELRQLCVDYFRLQLSFQWTPNETMKYIIVTSSTLNTCEFGKIYQGLPYVTNATGNLYIMMEYYDSETGVMDVKSKGGVALAEIIGNQCSFGSAWGWSRVQNTLTSTFTNTINEDHGWIKLGNYDYTMQNGKLTQSKADCKANGEQKMYEAYALFRPADGMVTYNNAGHVRMVCKAAEVVRDANGKIDGEKSFVTYLDQGSSFADVTLPDGTPARVQGGVDVKVSFANLYSTGYLPFTVAELIGKNPVEKATWTFSTDAPTITMEELKAQKLTSNYAISDVKMIIKDKNGTELYHYVASPTYVNTYEFETNPLVLTAIVKRYVQDKTNTVTLEARVGTGELFEIYSGTLVG